jgi:hypothetical protein
VTPCRPNLEKKETRLRKGRPRATKDYLRVRVVGALARTVPNARKVLEDVVARDPGFAPAWASLADLYGAGAIVSSRQSGSVEEVRQATQSLLDKAEMAARKAIELDSRYASGWGELGGVQFRRRKWPDAEKLFQHAVARRAGTRLRITAELVRADNGLSLWSDSYDRELADVFAIQEDIATAIAGALRMPLGLKPGERLVNNRTTDLKSYEDYLRVRAIGALARIVPNARTILEQAVARDPGFAPAWSSLASLYSSVSVVANRPSAACRRNRSR